MRMTRTLLASGLAAALAATPLLAQGGMNMGGMPESYREVQLRALGLQRRMLLARADSMPEALDSDRATPIQRDFAHQVAHAAGSVPLVVSLVLHVQGPQLPDTVSGIMTRAGLRSFINGSYDWAERTLRGQADRDAEVNLFGTRMRAWQLWDEMHEHSMWTAGQIVANFRKNGMAPPGFGFF